MADQVIFNYNTTAATNPHGRNPSGVTGLSQNILNGIIGNRGRIRNITSDINFHHDEITQRIVRHRGTSALGFGLRYSCLR